MEKSDLKYEPVDYYNKVLKDEIIKQSSSYFDNYLSQSKIDISKNQELSKKYEDLYQKDKIGEKNIKKYKVYRLLLIILAVISFISFIFMGLSTDELILKITFITLSILLPIIFILIIALVINKKLRVLLQQDNINNKNLESLYIQGKTQVSPLLDLFNWKDLNNIMAKTTDIFKFDEELSPLKLLMLRNYYSLNDEPKANQSVLAVSSGDINTNPFVRFKILSQTMYNKTYSNSITISWTTTYTDGKGNTRFRTHTQVLTATISKPAPNFSTGVYTIYGNQAAPNLTFTRKPSYVDSTTSESQLLKIEKKEGKYMNELAAKSLEKGGNFQGLANTRFEGIFQAYDRNNELEYRLMFTPLAQQNMMDLFTKSPFGDDFYFTKNKKYNVIYTKHSQNSSIEFNPSFLYLEFNYKKIKENFVNFISLYFENLYFDLAPVLAIPLYQQTDAGYFDYKQDLPNVSSYDAEAIANHFNNQVFKPDKCVTDQILKVTRLNSDKTFDSFKVYSYGFKSIPHTTIITKVGGDGLPHAIPVKWFEYIKVDKSSIIKVANTKIDEKEENKTDFNALLNGQNIIRNKNIIAYLVKNNYNKDNNN